MRRIGNQIATMTRAASGRADESAPGFWARFPVRHFLGDLRPDIFPEGHSSYTTELSVVPRGARELLGEFFELGARGGFALVGGDEVRPDGKQGSSRRSRANRELRKRPKSAALSFLISSGSVTSGGMGA